MGDTMKAIRDDYEEYLKYCKLIDVEPVGIMDSQSFYDHWKIIRKVEGGGSGD